MPCRMTLEEVDVLVKRVYRNKTGFNVVSETKLTGPPPGGLGLTGPARRAFFRHVREALEASSPECAEVYENSDLNTADFEAAKTIGDVVAMVQDALALTMGARALVAAPESAACSMTPEAVDVLVKEVYERHTGAQNVTSETKLAANPPQGLGLGGPARRAYYRHVREALQADYPNCARVYEESSLNTADFEAAKTVGKVVAMVQDALGVS